MSAAQDQSRQYFLGIAGAQTGPFTDDQVITRIREGKVPEDALVWFEGLGEWQPIQSIEFFKAAFSEKKSNPAKAAPAASSTAKASEPAAKKTSTGKTKKSGKTKKAAAEPMIHASVSFGESTEDLAPVFDGTNVFGDANAEKKRTILAGVAVVVALVFVGIYFSDMFLGGGEDENGGAKATRRISALDVRKTAVSHARSELLLKPDTSIETLKQLIQENSKDEAAAEAIEAVLDFYKFKQKSAEGAQFLLSIQRPAEAAKWFLLEPPSFADAEKAYFAAYQQATEPAEKKKFLLENIRLLLSPLRQESTAVEHIREFEKSFPGEAHAYTYYLKTPEQKLSDLFNRVAFVFLRQLKGFVSAELPEVRLRAKPTVELQKGPDGTYRIIAAYKGDVQLAYDRLKGIFIDFWWSNDQWYIVDSNITLERQKWARRQRKKIEGQKTRATEMLDILERTFKAEFPKNLVHEDTAALAIRKVDEKR